MNLSCSRPGSNLQNDKAMAEAVRHARIPLCITDPNLSDNPIVFANAAFLELTGYCEDDVIGRNCRFLQGEDTTPESVDMVRLAIDGQKVETIEIVNYRKDGSKFLNALQVGPILDDHGKLVFYFGSLLDITARRDAERQARKLADDELVHRLRNIVNVMSVVIRMTAREEQSCSSMASVITERLQTLSDAHLQTINRTGDQNLSFRDVAEKILSAYAPMGEKQFSLVGGDITVPTHLLSCVALCLHELATNSVKHGALGAETGKVAISWNVQSSGDERVLTFRWQETAGPEVVPPARQNGSKIIHDLIQAVGGSLEFSWLKAGLVAEAAFPLPKDAAR